MVSIAEGVLIFLDVFFAPMAWIASFFIYCESFLRTLSVGIVFVLTTGKSLTVVGKRHRKRLCNVLKWFLYCYYLTYTLYSLGIFTNLFTLNWLDWTTFTFSICAPISMVAVGKFVSNAKIKGRKVFVYIVIMLIYLLVGWLWFIFAPKTVIFEIFLIVWFTTLVIVGCISIISHFSEGGA